MMDAEKCFLTCLGLSQMLIDAAKAHQWERLQALQSRWVQQVQACIPQLQALSDSDEAQRRLSLLLRDVQEKTAELERIIQALQQQQQEELSRLKQAETYLSASQRI